MKARLLSCLIGAAGLGTIVGFYHGWGFGLIAAGGYLAIFLPLERLWLRRRKRQEFTIPEDVRRDMRRLEDEFQRRNIDLRIPDFNKPRK